MNSGEKVSCEFVVAGGNAAEILEPAKTALYDVASSVGLFVEAMERNAVGFIGDDGLGAPFDDLRSEVIAIIAFVAEQSVHFRRERQNCGGRGDVGVLALRQMENYRPAKRIAQRMDFCRAPATRPADRLIALPPFPPEAQR